MVECDGLGFLPWQKASGKHLGVVKLRKAITTVVVACAVAAGASGVATAAGPNASGKRCGTKYTPACKKNKPNKPNKPNTPNTPQVRYTKPKIKTPPVSARCVDTGANYRLPKMTFTANAGIRRIQVREGSKTVKVITFHGHGRTKYSLKHLSLHTLGLGSGGHAITVRVTDARGRSTSKTLRFSVCVATPVFTG